jgi:hypothetical protein
MAGTAPVWDTDDQSGMDTGLDLLGRDMGAPALDKAVLFTVSAYWPKDQKASCAQRRMLSLDLCPRVLRQSSA